MKKQAEVEIIGKDGKPVERPREGYVDQSKKANSKEDDLEDEIYESMKKYATE